MNELLQQIPFFNDLAPEEAAKLRDLVVRDPEAQKALSEWQAFEAQVKQRIQDQIPASSLLVLYALDQENPTLLSEAEARVLAEARPTLNAALTAIPALTLLIAQIRQQMTDFDAVWMEHAVPDVQPEINKRTTPILPLHPNGNPTIKTRRQVWGWAIAAVLALVALAVTLLMNKGEEGLPTGWAKVQTQAEETRELALADGSKVLLMPNSTLSYNAQAFDRHVSLEGKAFFDVTHDPAKTFQVETKNALTRVLGTSFGVDAAKGQTGVTLVEGKVSLANKNEPDRSVTLKAGEWSRVKENQVPTPPLQVNVGQTIAWTGKFIFRSTRVADAVAQVEKVYGIQIELDAKYTEEEVEGTYDYKDSPLYVLKAMTTFGAQVVQTGDKSFKIE